MKKILLIIISLILLAVVSYFGYHFLGNKKTDSIPNYTSTTMPAIYVEVMEKTSPFYTYSRNDEKIPIVEKRLSENPDNMVLQFQMALQYFYDGQNQRAIDMWLKLEGDQTFITDKINLKPGKKSNESRVDSLESYLAIGYLRLGEQLNCINMNNDESCVFPLVGGGIHSQKKPVEEAIDRFLGMIKKDPKDYSSIWLLNVACQANGLVPPQVPPELIIPASRIVNEYQVPRFNNISTDLGIEHVGLAGGTITEDFDNDGYIDIMNSNCSTHGQIGYFHNNGDGTFSDWTDKAKLTGEFEGVDIDAFDYNNDGWMDFVIPRGGWRGKGGNFPLSLMKNNGDGTFSDVTIEAGLLQFKNSQCVDFSDIDHDGDLDMFVGYENEKPSSLYLNNGNGTFTDIAKEAGMYFLGFVKAASFGDYNNDGFDDLYVSDFGHKNHLFRSDGIKNGKVHFTDVAATAGVENPVWSFACWWFDYDNDGKQDLYCSAYKPGYVVNSCREYMGMPMDPEMFPRLYHNNGDGTFTEVAKQMNIAYETFTMGCAVGDLNNDGWLEFYLGIGAPDYRAIFPKRMFINDHGKRFLDCTVSGGFGQLQKGHGIAFADLDFDGDQDVYADYGAFYSGDQYSNALYENPGFGNNWINIKFEGTKNNYNGNGAKVKITFTDSGGVKRTTYNVINRGGASFGNNPTRLQAGVGKATVIDEIEITWPIGNEKQVFKNVPVNKILLCKEGAAELTPINVHSFQFKTNERRMEAGDTTSMKGMKM